MSDSPSEGGTIGSEQPKMTRAASPCSRREEVNVYEAIQNPSARRKFAEFQGDEVQWGGMRMNYTGRLHEIEQPVLIVHGAVRPTGSAPGPISSILAQDVREQAV